MKSKILGLLAVGMLAGPMAANAVPITISGFGAADGVWGPSGSGMPPAFVLSIRRSRLVL